jgi:ribosomal protein S13
MHLRGALIALPKIGEVKADSILDELGWSADRHIDTLGVNQREQLIEAVAAHSARG